MVLAGDVVEDPVEIVADPWDVGVLDLLSDPLQPLDGISGPLGGLVAGDLALGDVGGQDKVVVPVGVRRDRDARPSGFRKWLLIRRREASSASACVTVLDVILRVATWSPPSSRRVLAADARQETPSIETATTTIARDAAQTTAMQRMAVGMAA